MPFAPALSEAEGSLRETEKALARLPGAACYALRAGDIVAAGTCTGLHYVTAPADVVADFGSLGEVRMTVVG